MKPECLQSFVEQLLSHYFFKDDSPSDPDDCQWFLKDGLDTQNESSLIQFISPSLYKFYLAKLLGSLKTIGYNPEVSRHFKPEVSDFLVHLAEFFNVRTVTGKSRSLCSYHMYNSFVNIFWWCLDCVFIALFSRHDHYRSAWLILYAHAVYYRDLQWMTHYPKFYLFLVNFLREDSRLGNFLMLVLNQGWQSL